jgi:hypothetical protein
LITKRRKNVFIPKGENLFRGSIYLAKAKASKKGDNSSKLRNACENLILILSAKSKWP